MTLVVILTVRSDARHQFYTFEKKAYAVMAKYGGRIERTVTIPEKPGESVFQEVHIVTFPSEQAFAEYRGDAELKAVAPQREASVIATEILMGVDGPSYAN
jgi:uncharacterized protein (DUF1330 family)